MSVTANFSETFARDRSKPPPGLASSAIPGFAVAYAAGAEIHGEGESAVYSYRIISGVVRTFRILTDGRRQIEGFYFPGDVFSMELSEHYTESAEAVSETRILVMKRALIDALTLEDTAVARELLIWTSQSLTRAREQMLLLGRKTAMEKVASFLLQLDADEDALALPMCRSDIADYLGLTVETISRVLAQLTQSEAIELPSPRCIQIRDRVRLSKLSSGTSSREAGKCTATQRGKLRAI